MVTAVTTLSKNLQSLGLEHAPTPGNVHYVIRIHQFTPVLRALIVPFVTYRICIFLPEQVKIIGPESSNADSHGLAAAKACADDPVCWAALDSIASHSYGM